MRENWTRLKRPTFACRDVYKETKLFSGSTAIYGSLLQVSASGGSPTRSSRSFRMSTYMVLFTMIQTKSSRRGYHLQSTSPSLKKVHRNVCLEDERSQLKQSLKDEGARFAEHQGWEIVFRSFQTGSMTVK